MQGLALGVGIGLEGLARHALRQRGHGGKVQHQRVVELRRLRKFSQAVGLAFGQLVGEVSSARHECLGMALLHHRQPGHQQRQRVAAPVDRHQALAQIRVVDQVRQPSLRIDAAQQGHKHRQAGFDALKRGHWPGLRRVQQSLPGSGAVAAPVKHLGPPAAVGARLAFQQQQT